MIKGRILLFTTDFPPSIGGGICTHSRFMVEELRKLNWSFTVLSEYYIPSEDEKIKAFSRAEGYAIYKLPLAPSLTTLVKKIFFCYKIAKGYKPNIIIGTGRHTSWMAAVVSFFTGVPLVTIGHGTEFTQRTSKIDFRLNNWAYGRSHTLIAISQYTKSVIVKAGIHAKRLVVVNNAADEALFKVLPTDVIESFVRQKGLEGRRIILTSGALTERKGQKVVIRSMPAILKEVPEAIYVAIGLPSEIEEMKKISDELHVSNHVLFPGVVSDEELVLWLNACEIFVMTSVSHNGDYEGFGIAVLEAALCRKASIVSNNGGLSEAVKDGVTGLVVKENDIEQTTTALVEVLHNRPKLEDLSQAAYINVHLNGTYEKKAFEYDRILSKLL